MIFAAHSLTRPLARVALIALGASLAAGAAQAAPEFKFTLHHFLGPQAPAHSAMLAPWAEKVKAASAGRIEIELFPSMSLGGAPPQLYRQAVDGVADIIWTVNGYTPGLFPRTEVFELPGVFTGNIAAVNLAMGDLFESHLAEEYKGVKVLWLHTHGGNALHMKDKRVTSPEDLKGLSLRSPGPSSNAVIAALGATPVSMPVPDLPQALATNHVQGALIPWEIIPALQLQQSTDVQIEGPDLKRFSGTTYQVSMNLDAWKSLPEDLQKVMQDTLGAAHLKALAKVWRDVDDAGIKRAVAEGNDYIVLDAPQYAAFQAALAPVDEAWIAEKSASFDAQGLYDAAKAAIAQHSQ